MPNLRFTLRVMTPFDHEYPHILSHTNSLDLVRLVEPGVVSQQEQQLPGVTEYLESRPLCIGINISPKRLDFIGQ